MMKTRFVATLALLALATCLAATSQATTMTFALNSEGNAPGNNKDVNENIIAGTAADDYGSNIAAETAAFITTDGTGATPDIGILWGPLHDVRPNVWEFHSYTGWGSLGDAPYVQIDVDDTPAGQGFPEDPTIDFIVPAGIQVDIHGFDLATAANSTHAPYAWTIDVIRISDDTVVASHTTIPIPIAQMVHVDIDFLGDVGESYRLKFDDHGEDYFSTAMDSLSFSQIPEPSTMALLALCGLGIVARRRRS